MKTWRLLVALWCFMWLMAAFCFAYAARDLARGNGHGAVLGFLMSAWMLVSILSRTPWDVKPSE